MMNLRRDAKETAFCGAIILAVWYVTQLGGPGSAIIYTSAALPVEDGRAPLFKAAAQRADRPLTAAISIPAVVIAPVTPADAVVAAEPEIAAATEIATAKEIATAADTVSAADTAAPADEPIVVAALPDPATAAEPELPSEQVALADPSDQALEDVKPAVSRIEITDECLVADTCIDQFLWAIYQRTRKEDSVKVDERRKVAVKRKGKMVTVTKTFSKRVEQDFTWKDPDAADRSGMSMMDYVIGGMDRGFKTKLFHALYAAEQAGLSPGITSAFRDDYRQSIANGVKAATGRSYHGGSSRGGYGHGLAADVVSVDGATRAQRWASTEKFWAWIDAHGKEFGIARPYLGRDPPHVGPIDGQEYASHSHKIKVALAAAASKLAARDGAAKTPKKSNTVQASSPVHPTKQGATSNRPRMAMAEPRG